MSDRAQERRDDRAGPEQQAYQPYDSATFFSVGFPGMKSTAMDDNVESWPCGTESDFGTVVTKTVGPTGSLLVESGGTGDVAGIALHDHIIATYGHYSQGMAVSVMTRGRVWCAVDGAGTGITYGAPASFNPANGKLSASGTAVPNSSFRGMVNGFYDMLTGTTINIVEVELHYPFAVAGP
jgi:hypothetical protein